MPEHASRCADKSSWLPADDLTRARADRGQRGSVDRQRSRCDALSIDAAKACSTHRHAHRGAGSLGVTIAGSAVFRGCDPEGLKLPRRRSDTLLGFRLT